ncbi:MAG: ABC transporter ATP-binding protein [Gammaproteobacteria bacterium]
MNVLQVENLNVSFHTRNGIVRAVQGLGFEVAAGKTLGIVGESGSGKSVSCLALLGLLASPPARIQADRAEFAGTDLLQLDAGQLRQIRGDRIAMIFQDPMTSLNPYLTVGTQLMEPLLIHRNIGKAEARERAVAALAETGIPQAAKRLACYPHEFSGGMRQRVMIAMAMINKPALLIADEPTTALDVTVQAQILELMQKLRHEHQLAMIFITHDLGVIAGLADELLVLEQGRCVERGTVDTIFHHSQAPYTRDLLAAIPKSAKPAQYKNTAAADTPPLLELADVSISYTDRDHTPTNNVVEDVHITLHKGEILGLAGESGSGKSTLARALVRLVRINSGRISLHNKNISDLSDSDFTRIRPQIQMIFQDPYASLNPRMTVHDCLAEAIACKQQLPDQQLTERVVQLLEEVDLQSTQLYNYPHEFSGGQRQRIAIARALALEPELIIADEPVSALDVTVQARILELFLRLNQRHRLSLIFISHDLSVVRYIADRTAILYQGKIVELDTTEKVFQQPQHPYTRSLLAAIPEVYVSDTL